MDDINNLINFLMPSNDRPESLYKQLSKSLNRAIQQGLLAPGDALMPERELAAKLNMSRITVRKAIGGRIVTFRHYDHKTDRNNFKLYVIPDDLDFERELGKMITLESMRG